jgi:ubiquinone/menaquinone biosynthesis C-methylase UbiE
MLGTKVVGIDVMNTTEAPIDYRRYDGRQLPVEENSVDAVLLCYVLHHAQDAAAVLGEVRRALCNDGLAIIYEDIPLTCWDKGVCWIHNRKWQRRSGPCTFRTDPEWRGLLSSSGFELLQQRVLSRSRNFTHLVSRSLYVIRRAD